MIFLATKGSLGAGPIVTPSCAFSILPPHLNPEIGTYPAPLFQALRNTSASSILGILLIAAAFSAAALIYGNPSTAACVPAAPAIPTALAMV